MNPRALIDLIRRVGPSTVARNVTKFDAPDPVTGMRFLPGMGEAMRDPYTDNLYRLLDESAAERSVVTPPLEGTKPSMWQGAPPFRTPEGPLTDIMNEPTPKVGTIREYTYENVPDPQDPTTHGFDLYDIPQGRTPLEIAGMTYRPFEERAPRDIDPTVSRAERMDEELANVDALIESASSVDEFGPSGIPTVDRVLGLTRERRAKKYAKAFADERKLDFQDLPAWKRSQIINELDYEGSQNADVPSTQGNNSRKVRPLKDSKESVTAGLRFDEGRHSGAYPGLFPALARGAVRGSFVEQLPADLRVGETYPLKVHPTSAMDVRVKGIHTFDPQGSIAERMRLLEMMGRGWQDQGTFSKPGHVIEWEAIEAIPMEGAASKFQVGDVRPIQRRNGDIVQMEVVGATDKKLLVRPVIPEEGDAAVSNRMEAVQEAVKNEGNAMYKVWDLASAMSDFWKKNLSGRRVTIGEDGRPQLTKESEIGNKSARTIDWRRAVSYALRSKAKKDDDWIYWSGARAVPLDATGKRWVVVQAKQGKKNLTNQGIDFIDVNDKGRATITRYGPDGKKLGGMEVPMVRLFHQAQIDMIAPNLKEWKKAPPKPGNALAPNKFDTPESRAAVLPKRLERARQLQERAPVPTPGVPSQVRRGEERGTGYTVERRADKAGRSASQLTVQEFAEVDPRATETPAAAKARTMLARELAKRKDVQPYDLENRFRELLGTNEDAPARKLARQAIAEADQPEAEFRALDRVIEMVQNGEELSPALLRAVARMVPDDVFAAYMREGAPTWIKDNPGSSRVNMGTGGPRDVTEGRTWVQGTKGGRMMHDEAGDITLAGGEPFVRQPGTPPVKKSTFRGKETKEGLTTIPSRPEPKSGLRVVEDVTVGDAKKHPGVIFISVKDANLPNVINIRKTTEKDIAKLLASKAVVVSKKVVAQLTDAEKKALAMRKVGSKSEAKLQATREAWRDKIVSPDAADARDKRGKGGGWEALKAKLAVDATESEKKLAKAKELKAQLEDAKAEAAAKRNKSTGQKPIWSKERLDRTTEQAPFGRKVKR